MAVGVWSCYVWDVVLTTFGTWFSSAAGAARAAARCEELRRPQTSGDVGCARGLCPRGLEGRQRARVDALCVRGGRSEARTDPAPVGGRGPRGGPVRTHECVEAGALERFGGVPEGCDPFSAGWAGWGEGAGGNGTLSPNGHGPVYFPGTLFPGPARAPYQAHLNITLTCYAIHDILYVPVLTRPPSFVLFLKRLEGPVCPGARGARPRGGRDTGVLAVPAQARIALGAQAKR